MTTKPRLHRPALSPTDLQLLVVGQRAAIQLINHELQAQPAGIDKLLDARDRHRALLERIRSWSEVPTR